MNTTTYQQEIIRHIINVVYRNAQNNIKVIDWIPPQNAGDDPYGTFIYATKGIP
jgi:hypothetical protein